MVPESIIRRTRLTERLKYSRQSFVNYRRQGVACSVRNQNQIGPSVKALLAKRRQRELSAFLSRFTSSLTVRTAFPMIPATCRGVAQPGRALGSGPRGRRFESSRPDQFYSILKSIPAIWRGRVLSFTAFLTQVSYVAPNPPTGQYHNGNPN
jgi:hypothetical protein